jgi:hypothetical protein
MRNETDGWTSDRLCTGSLIKTQQHVVALDSLDKGRNRKKNLIVFIFDEWEEWKEEI